LGFSHVPTCGKRGILTQKLQQLVSKPLEPRGGNADLIELVNLSCPIRIPEMIAKFSSAHAAIGGKKNPITRADSNR